MTSPEALIKFLMDCSVNSLGEYELARLNEAANMEKQIVDLVKQYLRTSAEAEFARFLIENRAEILRAASSHQTEFAFTGLKILRQLRSAG